MKPINMEEFANGAFSSQINRELKKVTENIQDPNTDATVKRRITITIDFKPNENRDFVTTSVQANFEVTQDLLALQKVTGNVEAKSTATYGDDGISQKTTIKQGIASKADVIVPNPVTLRPYRTFLEVAQPDSQFVFRIRDEGGSPQFKIVEAEGGLWRNEAMIRIKNYFLEELKDILADGKITVIA